MPEKKVSQLAFENDKIENSLLYLVGIDPLAKIEKRGEANKLRENFVNFYKESFVQKHDHAKIEHNVNTFPTLACINVMRNTGDITTLSAITHQMGSNKDAFIHWLAVSNKIYNDDNPSCRRLGFLCFYYFF